MRLNGRMMALVLGVGMLCACDTADADKHDLQRGYASFSERNLDDAEATATRFIEANPTSPNIDEAYYLRGISKYTRGTAESRRQAAEDLQMALDKSQHPDLKAKASRLLGDVDFEAQRWAEAQDCYEKALDLWASVTGRVTGGETYINYRIGACLQAQGKWDDAVPWFDRALAAHDDTFYQERTLARMGMRSYTLQFGAFQDAKGATALKTQLNAANIKADSISDISEGKLWYRVRAGTYHTYAEAAAARDGMIGKYQMVAIIP